MHFIFRGSKYILSDIGSEFTSKQLTWLTNKLGSIRVYTLPDTPTGNSIIERTHAFLKASLRKLICNHLIDWDEIAHIATIAYSVFPNFSVGEASFYLVFGCDAFMLTLFKPLH